MLPDITEHPETKVIRGSLEVIEMVGKDSARAYQWQVDGHWELESGTVQTRQKLKEQTLTTGQGWQADMSIRGMRAFEIMLKRMPGRPCSLPNRKFIYTHYSQRNLNKCQSVNQSFPGVGQARSHW